MIRQIVTHGLGFADGVKYIPTLGFTSGTVVVVTPPITDFSLDFLHVRNVSLDFLHQREITADF